MRLLGRKEDIHCDPFCMINFRMIFVSASCYYLAVTKKSPSLVLPHYYLYYLRADWKIVSEKKKIHFSRLKS